MFSSSQDESLERRISRLRAECGCEAGAIAALAGFSLCATILFLWGPSGVPASSRWLAAVAVAVVAGAGAKLVAIVYARVRLRRLIARVGVAAAE